MTGIYDGKNFIYRKSASTALSAVFKSDIDDWFAHFGGIFDFLFILQAALKNGYNIKKMIPRGSSILLIEIEKDGITKSFRDSSAILPFSLRKLASSFKTETQKGEIDFSRLKKVTPKLIKYNKEDCLSLHQVLSLYFSSDLIKRSGPAMTMASQAMLVYRTYLQKSVPRLSSALDSIFREAYAGGRTEIFKPISDVPIKEYDINSLYPFVMATNEYPGKYLGPKSRLDDSDFGFANVTISVPKDTYYPVLWRKKIDGIEKFLFPTGTFRGLWPIPEIRHAQANGAVIQRVHETHIFSNEGAIFRDYINTLYEIRKNTKDPVINVLTKLLMNSLYGRMGIRLDRETIEIDDFSEGSEPWREIRVGKRMVPFAKLPSRYEGFSNVAIAAFVTAYARIENHAHLLKIGSSCHYTDTDSFWTPSIIETGAELGELKLTREEPYACFLLPKTYVAGNTVKMKGFDSKRVQHFSYSDFRQAFEGELKLKIKVPPKMSRLSGALMRGKILHLQKASSKQLVSKYDKREFFRDSLGNWDSRPFHIG